MLKIKDSVDLKELEKFGIKKYDRYTAIKYLNGTNHLFINNYRNICVYAEKSEFDLDIIFDLIQAGLVEKVED